MFCGSGFDGIKNTAAFHGDGLTRYIDIPNAIKPFRAKDKVVVLIIWRCRTA